MKAFFMNGIWMTLSKLKELFNLDAREWTEEYGWGPDDATSDTAGEVHWCVHTQACDRS